MLDSLLEWFSKKNKPSLYFQEQKKKQQIEDEYEEELQKSCMLYSKFDVGYENCCRFFYDPWTQQNYPYCVRNFPSDESANPDVKPKIPESRDEASRTFNCPMLPKNCKWVGSHHKLREHYRSTHPKYTTKNNILPEMIIIKPGAANFLLSQNFKKYAGSFTFLLHVKICPKSGRFFHAVRLFGYPELSGEFAYAIEVVGHRSATRSVHAVLRTGDLALDEETANFFPIRDLLDISGMWVRIAVSFQTKIYDCVNCFRRKGERSEFCGDCEARLVKCKFSDEGCSYVDVSREKCAKHEVYFCEFRTRCFWCKGTLGDGSLMGHLASGTSCRKIVEVNDGFVVRFGDVEADFILVSTENVGTVVCFYEISEGFVKLWLYSKLASHQMKHFDCFVEFTDPETKHTRIVQTEIDFENWRDWFKIQKMDEFPSWGNNGVDVRINLVEKQPVWY